LAVVTYGRVDVIARLAAIRSMLEVNTLPGMTETSLLPKRPQRRE